MKKTESIGGKSENEKNLVDKLNLKSQEWRGQVLKPILRIATDFGLSASMITNGRLILAVIAFVIFTEKPILASIIFLLAILLDALDGPLARVQGRASDKGKFLDVATDHVIYVFIVLAILKLGYSPMILAFNIFIVGAAYLLATIKKNEFESTDWIIKPYPKLSYLKIITVIPFFALIFFGIDIVEMAFIACNLIATLLVVYYFVFIQARWRKHAKKEND
jgi:phosphatidylglycerophosphate synthase